MAYHNLTLNAGAGGESVAMDSIGGTDFQRNKPQWGAEGVATEIDDAPGKRLPVEIGHDGVTTLQASQVSGTSAATTTRTTTTGLGRFTDLDLLINITGGGVATGVLQLFIEDSVDGGTTWDDLVASNLITFGGGASNQQFSVSGRVATTRPQGQAAAPEALAAGSVRQGPWGDRLRVREKVSGVSGSPTGVTYIVTAVFKR